MKQDLERDFYALLNEIRHINLTLNNVKYKYESGKYFLVNQEMVKIFYIRDLTHLILKDYEKKE